MYSIYIYIYIYICVCVCVMCDVCVCVCVYMAVTKHRSFFAQSVCKLDHVRKGPVLYQRRHVLHVSH